MKQKRKRLTEEDLRMIEKMEHLIALTNNDPEIANRKAPEALHTELWRDIRKYEAEKAQRQEAARQEELVQKGLLYEKKCSRKKYYVIAAVAVLAMALGVTSLGGPEKVFEVFKIQSLGREQTHINSNENVRLETEFTEDAVYEEIEEKYGFYPVKLDYKTEGAEFLQATISDEIQGISILYGEADNVKIIYRIRPNYRNGSYGQDIEDELVETYEKIYNEIPFQISKYMVEDNTYRWTIKFEYQEVSYYILLVDASDEDVNLIIETLYMT